MAGKMRKMRNLYRDGGGGGLKTAASKDGSPVARPRMVVKMPNFTKTTVKMAKNQGAAKIAKMIVKMVKLKWQ